MTRKSVAKVTVSLRIDPELLATLDAVAERTGETRSAVAERAIHVGFGRAAEFLGQFDAETKAHLLRAASLAQLAEGLSPVFGEWRELRDAEEQGEYERLTEAEREHERRTEIEQGLAPKEPPREEAPAKSVSQRGKGRTVLRRQRKEAGASKHFKTRKKGRRR